MVEDLLPIALIVTSSILATWSIFQGSVINSSAEIEGKSTPVWGVGLYVFGVFNVVVNVLYTIVYLLGGGEGNMIPESAWPLLTGALTMIGAAFASALCIMVAAKAGAEMLVEKPELSIWSLLFVALGEGLAIYGLIVAILLSG